MSRNCVVLFSFSKPYPCSLLFPISRADDIILAADDTKMKIAVP